jgi:hypothetical protein
MLPAYLFPDPDQELRMASRELSPDSASIAPGYATCCVLLAKSRPEVGGDSALLSFAFKVIVSSTIWQSSSKICFSSSPWQPP